MLAELFDFLTFSFSPTIVTFVARGGFTESGGPVPQPLKPEPGNAGGGKRHDCSISRHSCWKALQKPLSMQMEKAAFLWWKVT